MSHVDMIILCMCYNAISTLLISRVYHTGPTAVEVEIGFVLTDLTVNEGENLTICLQLSDPVQDPVSVTIAATPGTAEGKTTIII